jgi:hypothetical protein
MRSWHNPSQYKYYDLEPVESTLEAAIARAESDAVALATGRMRIYQKKGFEHEPNPLACPRATNCWSAIGWYVRSFVNSLRK